jgi:hypothetical protein
VVHQRHKTMDCSSHAPRDRPISCRRT